MACNTRPLLDHQQRALAAAAGLVGRPRLRVGLALTLAFACGPVLDEGEPGESSSDALTDASSTLAPATDASTSTGLDDSSDAGTTDAITTTGATLLTDAGTTLASDTGDTSDTEDTRGTGGTDTGDSTGEAGSTGEAEDCIDRRTMKVDWICCEAQNWEPSPQCSPWGPPAPPTADRLLQARAARRVLA